ncbi:hypothetical protein [Cupriavidus pauculus]|uniref:DUF2846 domain-containing protein n=1 Tax=Cupriavidus pauculus TaxID=82633 RepID=A0A3G8H7R0_9BURK|nr:hypothetical protein [Cupriavidus pauculus]AZG16587.1 hypothetical protein EHF44_24740 [Cupriavidus pauculus]
MKRTPTCPACRSHGLVFNGCSPSFAFSLLALFATFGNPVAAHATPPQAVVESCLMGAPAADGISVSVNAPGNQSMEQRGRYLLIWPEEARGTRIGYATDEKGGNDYIFAGPYRGYIRRAVALTKWRPERLEVPLLATYGVVRQGKHRYVCVTEANGQGTAAFVVAGYIGRMPPAKGKTMRLYYTVADIKTFKAFPPR